MWEIISDLDELYSSEVKGAKLKSGKKQWMKKNFFNRMGNEQIQRQCM